MVDKIYNWKDFIPQDIYDLENGKDTSNFFGMIVRNAIYEYKDIEKTSDWQSIDEAEGKALDKIGENFGEYRGEAGDSFFRFMIKSKILASRSKGTVNEIINIIQKSLNVDMSKINVLQDRYYDTKTGKFIGAPYTISIERLPLSFTADDFQKIYLIKRIEESVATGIKISNISFLDYSNAPLYISAAQSVRKTYTLTESAFAYVNNDNLYSNRSAQNGYIGNNGVFMPLSNDMANLMVKIEGFGDLLLQIFDLKTNTYNTTLAFFDKNKAFISYPLKGGNTVKFDKIDSLPYQKRVSIPSGAAYFSVSFSGNDPYAKRKVEVGQDYTDWKPNKNDLGA